MSLFCKILILIIIFFGSLIYTLISSGIEYIENDLSNKKCPNCEEYNLIELKLKEDSYGYKCMSCGQVYWVKRKRD